jgi:hypothetical protein
MRQGIETGLAVVIPNARASHSPVGHRLNEQKHVGLIYGAPAKRKRR